MDKYQKRMRPLLGTFVEVGAFAAEKDFNKIVLKAFERIEQVQNLLSCHNPESDLSKLNRRVGEKIKLNPISIIALRIARYMTASTNGIFNYTIGGKLVELKVIPNHKFGCRKISGQAGDLSIKGISACLRQPVIITLDGIAKGYAVDLAVKKLKQCGLKSGWINAGGDMRIFGNITLPVHRRELNGEFISLGNFSNVAIATSEVKLISDDRFLGRILSPKDEELEPGTWTVAAPSAWLADALTKVACTAPSLYAKAIVAKFGAVIINERMSN